MAKKKGVLYWEEKLIGSKSPGGVINRYIKFRDAIRFEGDKPVCLCITCGKEIIGQNLQAGHYVGRRHKKVAYDLRNINAQCGMPCNHKNIGKGEPIKYRKKLLEMYGLEVVEELEAAVYVSGVKHWQAFQLEAMYYEFKDKLKEIKDRKLKRGRR